jgi:hypothetical protein
MRSAQALELGGDPIGEVVATIDVIGEETLLGGGERLPIKQAEVSIGRPQVYRAEPSPDIAGRLLPGPDGRPWRFYLVVFPFTLHPLPGRSAYQSVTFSVALGEPAVTAFELLPDRVIDPEEHRRTVKLGFKLPLKLAEVEASAQDEVVLKELRPRITSFGIGESRFYWSFTNEAGVELGSRRVAAIIQMPQAVHSLDARLSYDFSVRRKLFDFVDPVVLPAHTEPWSIAFALD